MRSIVFILMGSITVMCLGLAGCTEGEQPDPLVAIDLEEGPITVKAGETYAFTATVLGGETKEVDWYVDEILGGNSTVGTITQTNPAVYTAPTEVPPSDTVVVLAVSAEDETKADACVVRIVEQRLAGRYLEPNTAAFDGYAVPVGGDCLDGSERYAGTIVELLASRPRSPSIRRRPAGTGNNPACLRSEPAGRASGSNL